MTPKHPDDAVTGSPRAQAAGSDPGSPAAPTRAAAAPRPASMHSLEQGTRLLEFELNDFLGEGGFSIVYRAWDHSLERIVALKEYMPGSLATRDQDTRVHVRSSALQPTFDAGLRSFVNESKLLASFDHPSLVKVYRFWEANGTAYMVMPFYEGLTLRDTVQAMSTPPSQEWILAVLAPLTDALGYIHARSCYHRDIAPDNILMLADSGRPLLLDFGAARRVITDLSQALTVIVKAGYAPIEQYAEVAEMTQGSWTDVHALAAVIYWMITGKKPQAAIARMLRDNFVPLAELRPPGYSIEFLSAVDRGLALLPQNRTRTIEAFAEDIGLRSAATAPGTAIRMPAAVPESVPPRPDRTVSASPPPLAATQHPPISTLAPAVELPLDMPPVHEVDDDMTVAHPGGGTSAFPASPPAPAPTRAPAPVTAASIVPIAPDDDVDDRDASPKPMAPPPTGSFAAAAPPSASRGIVDSARPAPARRAVPLMLAGGIALVAGAAVTAWLALRSPTPTPTPAPTPPPVAIPADASLTPPAARLSPPSEPAPLPRTEPAASTVVAPVDATPPSAPAPRTETPPPTRHTRPAASANPVTTANPNAAECARIMQRLSLGETSADLLERAASLHCK